jgi:hypothetical protein
MLLCAHNVSANVLPDRPLPVCGRTPGAHIGLLHCHAGVRVMLLLCACNA